MYSTATKVIPTHTEREYDEEDGFEFNSTNSLIKPWEKLII